MKLVSVLLLGIAMCACLGICSTATEYKTYSCDDFTVEYPNDWITMDKQITTAYEGWRYPFINTDNTSIINVVSGMDGNHIKYICSIDYTSKGLVFDEEVTHFINTLEFKKGDIPGKTDSPDSYNTYDCRYFRCDYPNYGVGSYVGKEFRSILDTLVYQVSLCDPYGHSEPGSTGYVTISDDGTFIVTLLTERSGHFVNEEMVNFIKTLKFKG